MLKTKKIVIFLCITVIFSIFLCLGVSAEQGSSSFLINITEARATDYYDGYYGTFYTLSPAKLLSPYGGTAQCFKFSSSQNVSGVRGKDAKFYFNNYTFKKDVKYTIDTYIFYPWAQLINNDSSYPDSIIDMQLFLCDDTNKSRVDFDIPKDMPLLNGTNWDYKALKEGNSSAYFGFYKTSVTFVPNENFVGSYFDFSISHTHQTTSGGYFGLSDLIVSYEYDGTQAIIDNQNSLYEQEKQDAEQSGNDSIDGALDSIPNDGEDIIGGFDNFLSCMLHTETNCSIEFPSIKTPAIMGIPSYTLTEPTEVNFNEFEEIIPEAILLIVRALLTIALIIFCYKELYSTIQYVVTLRNGGGT